MLKFHLIAPWNTGANLEQNWRIHFYREMYT